MAETVCKRRCSAFYFPKYTFDSIPISMCESLKSVAIFSQNRSKIISIVDEKYNVVKLISVMKLSQKPPCRLFRCRRKETDVQDFVRLGIDSAVQPKFLTVEADHLLVDRKLIRRHRRNRL